MKNWFKFIIQNKRLLNFGFFFNFFSSFGQTFFISLFVPYWIESFKISNGFFGVIYSIVTIISAVLLSISGKYIDKIPLKKFGLIVFSGLMISVILLSNAFNIYLLVIGLLFTRWFGQGLMTHTSATGIVKHFQKKRGKALGITSLGHPAGQFILPLVIVPLISITSWNFTLFFLALFSSLLIIPSLLLIRKVSGFEPDSKDTLSVKSADKNHYFKTLNFWIITINIFIIPFICTAIFLYQYSIGQSKGWDHSWIAFSFSFFAVFSAISLILSGNLVDRFSGVFLFPLYLIPAIIALVLMTITNFIWIAPVFYALLGISSGSGSTIKTALQAEIYGTGNIGKIRSYFSAILVISTALGPPVFGFMIDKKISFSIIMSFFAFVVFLVMIISFKIWKYKKN